MSVPTLSQGDLAAKGRTPLVVILRTYLDDQHYRTNEKGGWLLVIWDDQSQSSWTTGLAGIIRLAALAKDICARYPSATPVRERF